MLRLGLWLYLNTVPAMLSRHTWSYVVSEPLLIYPPSDDRRAPDTHLCLAHAYVPCCFLGTGPYRKYRGFCSLI